MTFMRTRNVHVTLEIDATVRIRGEYGTERSTDSAVVEDVAWEFVDVEAVMTDLRLQLVEGTAAAVDRAVGRMTHDELTD